MYQDPGHNVPKRNLSRIKDKVILNPVLTHSQISATNDFDSDCAVVHSFKDDEIKDAQNRDHDLSRFIELFNEHTEKPTSKSLAS